MGGPPINIPDLMEPSTSSGAKSRSTSASSKTCKSPKLVQSTKDHSAKASKRPRDIASQAKGGKDKKRKTQSKNVPGIWNPDDEETEDELMDQAGQHRIKVLALKCTEIDCEEMVPDRESLHGHLDTVHRLKPLPCFAPGCAERFKFR